MGVPAPEENRAMGAGNMPDLHKMDRTWLCSVLFMDIARYSTQSVELQMKWKQRFNGYLAEAIQDVPANERVILATGDGAAVCFLGAPEAAMFAALHLWQCFVHDETERQPGLRVRIGVNLGPVKLVKDLNGSLNAIGDGINAGQRIMSFAPENQILVSQSFFEVVSRLSDDYKALFRLKGVETDKHVREHTVYSLLAPGSEKWHEAEANAGHPGTSEAQPGPRRTPAGPGRAMAAGSEDRARIHRLTPVLMVGVVVAVLAAAGAWYLGHSGRTNTVSAPTQSSPAVAAPIADQPSDPVNAKPAPRKNPVKPPETVSASSRKETTLPPPAQPAPLETKVAPGANAAYDQGMRLIAEDKPAEAIGHFDDALRVSPDSVNAYLGRAEARRLLGQYEMSIEDCNRAMHVKSDEPRPYFCRGLGRGFLKQYDAAVLDYTEAIRLNPEFALAYANRGNAYNNLEQYDRAVQDFDQAIRRLPNNAQFHMRRAAAYENLKQYGKAIQDYDDAIRLQPGNARAYQGRAHAKNMSGDGRAAAADRRAAQQLKDK
jgi:class 3 adenylate cyclase/Tfp pilus assembly protein PilF